MGSGIESIQVNGQERADSADINRAQALLGAGVANILRALLDDGEGVDDLDAGAISTVHSTLDSPLRGEVLQGLLVSPDPAGGTLSLGVGSGTLLAIVPSGNADDSNYRIIVDAGLANGGLTMTGNTAGQPRVDVIECQQNATDLTTTATRDIWDAVNEQYTPTVVTKTRAAQLSYRVRLGTPGAGFPGAASGWLPLAVALVPNGATTNDNIVFWDVRRLINDRIFGWSRQGMNRPTALLPGSMLNAVVPATAGGRIEAYLNGHRMGGRLRSGNDGTTGALTADAETIDLTSVLNRESGFSVVASALWYLYLCAPFGLPRWARYTTGPTNRAPRSPRGIPIVSAVAPDAYGRPSATVNMPASWGAGVVQTTEAVCPAVGFSTAGAAFTGPNVQGDECYLRVDGFAFNNTGAGGFVGSSSPPVQAGGTITGSGTQELDAKFTFTSGTHYPAHARAAKFDFAMAVTDGSGDDGEYEWFATVYSGANNVYSMTLDAVESLPESGGTGAFAFSGWVPVPTTYPSTAAASFDIKFSVRSRSAAATLTVATFTAKVRLSAFKL